MKTIRQSAVAEALNRRTFFNPYSAAKVKRQQVVPLVGVLLIALGGNCTQAAEATYKLFGREVGGYASKGDLAAIVKKDLGPRAALADWDEIKTLYGGTEADLKAFCEKVGLAPNGSAWVTKGGNGFWQDERRYFIYRADHKLPEDFMLHEQMQNNFLLLGSWYTPRPILVKIIDFNATDAALLAKADKLLATANSANISGVYALVSVNGAKVPANVSHEGRALQVRSGTFTIKADGKCASKMTFVPPSGTELTVEVSATYTREGPRLDMQWEGAGGTSGTIAGDTFTMDNEGMVLVYRRMPTGGGPASAKIGAAEAQKHYNETLVVTGQVAQVTFRPAVVYLNLDKPFPDSPFAAVVFSAVTNRFGDLSMFKGKKVEIKGTIKEYRGKPEIVLEETNQLRVVGETE